MSLVYDHGMSGPDEHDEENEVTQENPYEGNRAHAQDDGRGQE